MFAGVFDAAGMLTVTDFVHILYKYYRSPEVSLDNYSRPCWRMPAGRLFYFARVFYFFFYLTNLRQNGRTPFGTKYGRT